VVSLPTLGQEAPAAAHQQLNAVPPDPHVVQRRADVLYHSITAMIGAQQ
jgi:hypothetical protein